MAETDSTLHRSTRSPRSLVLRPMDAPNTNAAPIEIRSSSGDPSGKRERGDAVKSGAAVSDLCMLRTTVATVRQSSLPPMHINRPPKA